MFFKTIYNKLTLLIGTILMMTWMAACQWVAEPAPGNGSDSDPATTFRLTLTVSTNTASGTRADRDDDFEEIGTDAENYLDFLGGDFRIVLFDKEGNYLMEFGSPSNTDPNINWILKPGELITNSYQDYLMEVEYKFPERFTEEQLTAIRNTGVQIMVIANCKSLDNGFSYEGKFGVTRTSKLSDLWKNTQDLNFNYALMQEGGVWLPEFSNTRKRLIPMFGYSSVSKFEPRYNNGPYSASLRVPMQRAMAKIEVIDNLYKLGVNYEIDDVRMTDYNGAGRVIPDIEANDTWNQVGTQVTSSSLPDDVKKQTPLDGIRFYYDEPNKTWIAYVPEMDLGNPKGGLDENKVFDATEDANLERTHLNVHINFHDEDLPAATYPVHFAKYTQFFKPSIPDNSWNHILRNHIYRFYINNVGIDAELELHVKPWDLDEDEIWDYTDHVTIGRILEWAPGTYESIDEETGRVYLKIDPEVPFLDGTFEIKSPVNGRWYALLTPLDAAKPEAVTFVDADGEVLEPSSGDPAHCHEATGIIEKETPAHIRIQPTFWGNDDESAFKLEFFVENLGVWIRVPMVKDGAEYTTYTIVRKGNRIIG